MSITSLESMSSSTEQAVKNNLENLNTYGINNTDLQNVIKAGVGDTTKNNIDFKNSSSTPYESNVEHYSQAGYSFKMDRSSSVRAKYNLTCGAGSTLASSGTSSYIIFSTANTDFYMWFNVNGATTDPAHARRTGVEVAIPSAYTSVQVAQAIADKINTSMTSHFTATVSSNIVTITAVPYGFVFPSPRVTSLTSPWAFAVVSFGLSLFSIQDASGDNVFSISDQGYTINTVNQSSPFNSTASATWTKATGLRSVVTTINRWYKIADLFLYFSSTQVDITGMVLLKKVAVAEIIRADFTLIVRQDSPFSSTPICELLLRQTGNYDQPILKAVITCDNSIEKRVELYVFSPVTESNQLYFTFTGQPNSAIKVPINIIDTGIASLPSGTQVSATNFFISTPTKNIISDGILEISQELNTTGSIDSNTSFVEFTGTGGGTLTLPSASSYSKKTMIIKDFGANAGTNNITIQRAGSDLIDGATSIVINTNRGVKRLYSNGTAWGEI
jgi:hypothetical protein